MKKQGAELIELDMLKEFAAPGSAELTVLQYEFKEGLNAYLSAAGTPVKSLAGVIAFNKEHEEKAMPYFKQEILEQSEARGGLDEKAYKDALHQTLHCRNLLDSLFKTHRLDALCTTTLGTACAIDLVNGDYDTGFSFTQPAAMAGYPHITVPMGKVHELPAGLSFTGPAWHEGELLALAYAYEQASHKRCSPAFTPSLIPS